MLKPNLPHDALKICAIASCSQRHWTRVHKLMCTGAISDDEAESSPLFNFKIHACATNEIFLLVADVFSSICCEVEKMKENLIQNDTRTVTDALRPYSTFVRNPWWEVAVLGYKTSDGESPEKLDQTLRQLVAESWQMLSKALDLDGRGLTEVLSSEYMARSEMITKSKYLML